MIALGCILMVVMAEGHAGLRRRVAGGGARCARPGGPSPRVAVVIPWLRQQAVADALAIEQAEAKLRAILGCTELPVWVLSEIDSQHQTCSIPVPEPDGLPRYLRTPSRLEATELVLAMVMEGEIP